MNEEPEKKKEQTKWSFSGYNIRENSFKLIVITVQRQPKNIYHIEWIAFEFPSTEASDQSTAINFPFRVMWIPAFHAFFEKKKIKKDSKKENWKYE